MHIYALTAYANLILKTITSTSNSERKLHIQKQHDYLHTVQVVYYHVTTKLVCAIRT